MTEPSGIDHVLDAIDTALWDWAESPDAMTVRYGANGDSGPGALAEPPDRYTVGGRISLPSAVHEASNVYISARGIEWVDATGAVLFEMRVDPDMPEDSFRIVSRSPEVRTPEVLRLRPLLWARVPRRPIPGWRIDWEGSRALARPPRPQVNVEAIREALRNIQPPRVTPPPPDAIGEVMRRLVIDLQPVAREITTRFNEVGQAVIKVRETFRLGARSGLLGPMPGEESPRELAARERALEARRNRNTGPSRNPHRHRGI